MARQLFAAALALAHCATALLDGYVEKTVVEHVVLAGKLNAGVVGNVLAEASTTDPGLLACATADVILSSCIAKGVLETTAPTASAKACLCCYQDYELVEEYSSCASYIYNSFRTQTEAFSTVSQLYEICDAVGTCGAPAPPTRAPTQSVPSAPATTRGQTTQAPKAPVGCTSFINIYTSCSDEIPNFTKASDESLVECFCYDNRGNYNTRFDDYAASCAPWAKTEVPEDYEAISYLADFCEAFPPVTSAGVSITTRRPSTRSSLLGGGGDSSVGPLGEGISVSPPATRQSASSTTTVTTRNSAAFGHRAPTPPGIVAWAANLATVVVGYFFLI